MEIEGIITTVFAKQSGTSKNGKEWTKQDFILEVEGQYTRHILFTRMGADKIEKYPTINGQHVKVSFDIDAREYNGKWYNSVTAFKVENLDGGNMQPVQQNNDGNNGAPYQAPNGEYRQNAPKSVPKPDDDLFPTKQSDNQSNQQNNSEDDLPF